MSTQFDVIVVGGGLVGASLALALEPLGYSVALVEPYGPPALPGTDAWDSRIYSISPGSAALLAACGAWDSLPQDRITRVEVMQIYGDDITSSLRFSAYDAGLRELAYIAENSVLHQALWHEIQQSASIRVYCPARCASILWQERAVSLTLADGEELTAELVVGADGADSWVREQAGIGAVRHPYG
ncbi:MAG TPA: FAD-dependent oxidoreductase, partial [Burkholderiales bacterium]